MEQTFLAHRKTPPTRVNAGPYTISPVHPRFLPDSYVEASALETEEPEVKSTNLQTGFNIVNNYVGIVLLSMAFCFGQAGWFTFIALGGLTAFGAYTGSLIVHSYIVIEGEGESVPSYAQIGQRCLGSFGKWLVLGSSILETYIAILCMNIIIWNNGGSGRIPTDPNRSSPIPTNPN